LFVPFQSFIDVFLGWDDVLRRWADTRAFLRPLRITFGNGMRKVLYIYVRKVGARVYGREDKALYVKLKSLVESVRGV